MLLLITSLPFQTHACLYYAAYMYIEHLLLCVLSLDVRKPHKHIHMYSVVTVSVLSDLNDFISLIYFYQLAFRTLHFTR